MIAAASRTGSVLDGLVLPRDDFRPQAGPIRTVARGGSLLAPAVTRNLIGRFATRVRPAATEPDGRALATLSPREREVLRLIAAGLADTEIAEELGLGFETVKTYVSGILTKPDLRDRVQAVVFAYRTGFATNAEP